MECDSISKGRFHVVALSAMTSSVRGIVSKHILKYKFQIIGKWAKYLNRRWRVCEIFSHLYRGIFFQNQPSFLWPCFLCICFFCRSQAEIRTVLESESHIVTLPVQLKTYQLCYELLFPRTRVQVCILSWAAPFWGSFRYFGFTKMTEWLCFSP